MNKNRFLKQVVVAGGSFFLCVAAGLTRPQSAPPVSAHTSTAASPVAQPKKDTPPDDFAGLQYTDEQKTEIDKIRQETKSQKDVVAKDEKLTADQKDAMLLGYTRIEYGRIYKVLTPEQRKEVNQRMRARREADQAAKQKQPPGK